MGDLMGRPPKRVRAKIAGGYVRKTVSLPAELVTQIDEYLTTVPGMSISVFMTDAGVRQMAHVNEQSRRKA